MQYATDHDAEFGIVYYFIEVKGNTHYAALCTMDVSPVEAACHMKKVISTSETQRFVHVSDLKKQILLIDIDDAIFIAPFVNEKECE